MENWGLGAIVSLEWIDVWSLGRGWEKLHAL